MRFGGFNPSTNKINEEQEDFDEEIYVSNKIVVWSRGNVLYKSFKYDEPVIQALFVWFKVDQRQQSNNYTTTSTNNNNNHNKDLSGRQRCLFVILENSAKVYFLDGQQFLLRIPFVVKKAWAMNLGVLFQCQHKDIDENDDYYHYHTRDYINYSKFAKLHLPTLYSLLDPLEEIKPVSIVDKIYYDGSNIKLSGHKFLFTYPDEHIVFVNDQCENGNHIIVTLNQFTLRHSFILDNSEPCIEENENEEEHNSKVFIAHEFDALNLISNNFSSDGSCYELEITPNFELNNVIAAEPVYATRSLLCDVLLLKKINDDSYMLELWIGCGEYPSSIKNQLDNYRYLIKLLIINKCYEYPTFALSPWLSIDHEELAFKYSNEIYLPQFLKAIQIASNVQKHYIMGSVYNYIVNHKEINSIKDPIQKQRIINAKNYPHYNDEYISKNYIQEEYTVDLEDIAGRFYPNMDLFNKKMNVKEEKTSREELFDLAIDQFVDNESSSSSSKIDNKCFMDNVLSNKQSVASTDAAQIYKSEDDEDATITDDDNNSTNDKTVIKESLQECQSYKSEENEMIIDN
ncbi:1492_t:CDS:2 [Entrophospora sp. SA101]|nr:1492_t:CDS:2 [Entrophospora sp. SA101]